MEHNLNSNHVQNGDWRFPKCSARFNRHLIKRNNLLCKNRFIILNNSEFNPIVPSRCEEEEDRGHSTNSIARGTIRVEIAPNIPPNVRLSCLTFR